jgi:sRNA-binding regulator protein Hfq
VSDSILYTIGTALNRARDADVPVQVLVEGRWMAGTVVAVDGHGVVLSGDEHEHAVIRIERVAAVRVLTAAPHRTPLPVARPMPERASA